MVVGVRGIESMEGVVVGSRRGGWKGVGGEDGREKEGRMGGSGRGVWKG